MAFYDRRKYPIFGFGVLGLTVKRISHFLGFQLFKQREGKEVEKKSRYGLLVWKVWNFGLEILVHVWVRKFFQPPSLFICRLGKP